MKVGIAKAMALAALLAGCAQQETPHRDHAQDVRGPSPVAENFAFVFERMKTDSAFTRSRIAAGFTINQHSDAQASD